MTSRHVSEVDLLACNGHVYPQVDRIRSSTSCRQSTQLFRNMRNGRFADVSGSLGAGFTTPKSSRGAAVGDLDNDGTLDIVLNNLDGPPSVLRNRGGQRAGHWLEPRLVGDPALGAPRDAIGAVVFCSAGTSKTAAPGPSWARRPGSFISTPGP